MKYSTIFSLMALTSLSLFFALVPSIEAVRLSQEYTLGRIHWENASFPMINGTGRATIIVNDPDMNKISSAIDSLDVFVFSDSYAEGITLTLYETEKNSGVFDRTFTLSQKRSAPNILYTWEGDTATAVYVDSTLPPSSTFSKIETRTTALIGISYPPLERVNASSFRIQNFKGELIKNNIVLAGKQISLVADIQSQENRTQNFAYLVQIQDERHITVSLSWLTGTLVPLQSFTPSQSWIPQEPGKYFGTVFVWESVDNPTALSPTLEIEIKVKNSDLS
jgi:hypothetical protein